jgi:hypothetical protein
MSWNYRVVKEKKFINKKVGYLDNYRVVEVFYNDKNEINGWADSSATILSWDNYDDLKGTSEYVLKAFEKPVLTVKGDELEEI